MAEPFTPKAFPSIQGRCPACHGDSLFIGTGGYVTCSRIDCPKPEAADQLLHGDHVTASTPLAVPHDTATTLHRALGQLLGDEDAHAIARVRALHRQEYNACDWCSTNDRHVPYPCPTIRALDGKEQP